MTTSVRRPKPGVTVRLIGTILSEDLSLRPLPFPKETSGSASSIQKITTCYKFLTPTSPTTV